MTDKERIRARENVRRLGVQERVKNETLERLKDSSAKINQVAGQQIVFSPAWISLGDVPIIAKGTITIIQGKAGSHKSRLAEMLSSLLLSNSGKNPVGLSKYKGSAGYYLAYIDTERSTAEDFPAAVQRIRHQAGHSKTDDLRNFFPVSVKTENRDNRLHAVRTWIDYVRSTMEERGVADWNLCVVLDVVTDCAASFNDDRETLALFDYVNNLCEEYGTAFILLVHENPGTDKARGHIGTEGMNKANTQIQIGYERESDGSDSNLIKLKFLKTRNARKPEPLVLEFSKNENSLVPADKEAVKEYNKRNQKENTTEATADALERIFSTTAELQQQDLVNTIANDLSVSEKTALRRIKELIDAGYKVRNKDGKECRMEQVYRPGKATTYKLVLPENDVPF